MKALALTLAVLAAQVSPVPLEHFTITVPEAGIYQMHAPLLAEGVDRG